MSDISTAIAEPLAVPELPSTVNTAIDPVEINAADELGLLPGIQGPKDALGSDATEEMQRMEAAMRGETEDGRKRGPDGKFLPKDDVAPVAVKPAAKKAVAVKPIEAVKPPAPVIAKVKIGDEEKTAEEWAKEFKDLKEKSAQPPKIDPPKVEKKDPTPEDQAKREREFAESRRQFVARSAQDFNPAEYGIKLDAAQLDQILVGGEEAVKAFMGVMAQFAAASEARSREWVVDTMNPVLKGYDERMAPMTQREQAIMDYQRDSNFLESNPDIKAHAEGLSTSREIRASLDKYYDEIQQKIATGTASSDDIAHAHMFENATPEKFEESVAAHVRNRLKIVPGSAAPTPEPVKAVTPPAPKIAPTKPFNGDGPGGGNSAPKSESADARALREIHEHGR